MWKSLLASIVFLLSTTSVLYAGPALNNFFEIQQPDGASFKARKHGDEFQNWTETEHGHTVLRNKKTKEWEYAVQNSDGTLLGSGQKVIPGQKPPVNIPKKLKPKRNTEAEKSLSQSLQVVYQQRMPGASPTSPKSSSKYAASIPSNPGDWNPIPVSGTRNIIMILVNFTDQALTTTAEAWAASVFSTTPGVKSITNYYKDNSFSMLSLSPVAHTQQNSPPGVVTVSVGYPHPFNGTPEDTWVAAAINAANPFVNFAALDANNNGYIDRTEALVYLIPAGYEDSGSSKTPSVWAKVTDHSSGGLSAAGKLFSAYAMSGELNDSSIQHPIGVIAHEMGHLFCGLPDLYDTSNKNKGMGFFSLMAAGSWGKDSDEYEGTTPTNLDAWSREYLGWSTPEAPASATPISLAHSLSSKNSVLKLISPLTSTTEYFLVENRQPIGWDRGLRGVPEFNSSWAGGLLVTHIDIAAGTPGDNDINSYDVTSINSGHQGVVPVQASTATCNMLAEDTICSGHPATLFYSTNNFNFTPVTTPNSNYYNGSATNFSLVNISAPAANITGVLAFTAPTNKTLNVSKTGTGSGIITSSLAGISCSATCSAQFVFPTSLALTAIPSADSAFTGWSGACTGTANPCMITSLDDLNTVQANFSTALPIVSETFSLASLPEGWSAPNAISGKNWQFNGSPCQFPNETGGSGNYALAELNCVTAPMNSDAALYTPSYNLSTYGAVTLSFKTNFTYWYSSTADVDISNDGGATWNTVWRKTGGTPDSVYGPISEVIDVTALVSGKSDVKIRFRYYTSGYGNMWQIDDFALNGVLIPPVEHPLTVTLAGTGSGSINSIPSGFICPELGGNNSCSKSYPVNTPITLIATPDSSNSVFSGWTSTAPCSGTGNCDIIMDSAKNVTATFTLAPLVTVLERPGGEFSTISDAYGDLNTLDGHTIRARVNSAPFGPLILNRAIAITLKGGFDPAFSPGNTGFSKIGSLTVATGSLTVEKIIIN